MNLYQTIKHIYPDIDDKDFVLKDDGNGPYILSWTSSLAQPTDQELQDNWANVEFSKAVKDKLEELDQKCNSTILGNFPFPVNGVTYYFPNDDTAQKNFDKFYIAFKDGIASSPENFTCYDANGNTCRVGFDETTFPDLYKAHLSHIASNVAKFRDNLEPQVKAVTVQNGDVQTAINQVNAITW